MLIDSRPFLLNRILHPLETRIPSGGAAASGRRGEVALPSPQRQEEESRWGRQRVRKYGSKATTCYTCCQRSGLRGAQKEKITGVPLSGILDTA